MRLSRLADRNVCRMAQPLLGLHGSPATRIQQEVVMPRPIRMASPAVANPNLTPLLDVVLQLITFFMMLVHFGTRLEGSTKAVRLPVAPAALPGTDLTIDRLPVAMNAQGRLLVKNQVLDEDAASAWWAAQANA